MILGRGGGKKGTTARCIEYEKEEYQNKNYEKILGLAGLARSHCKPRGSHLASLKLPEDREKGKYELGLLSSLEGERSLPHPVQSVSPTRVVTGLPPPSERKTKSSSEA